MKFEPKKCNTHNYSKYSTVDQSFRVSDLSNFDLWKDFSDQSFWSRLILAYLDYELTFWTYLLRNKISGQTNYWTSNAIDQPNQPTHSLSLFMVSSFYHYYYYHLVLTTWTITQQMESLDWLLVRPTQTVSGWLVACHQLHIHKGAVNIHYFLYLLCCLCLLSYS